MKTKLPFNSEQPAKTEVKVPEDESTIEVCECCGGRDIAPQRYDDGWLERTYCPDCVTEHYPAPLDEYMEKINEWWASLNADEAKHLSEGAVDRTAWWQNLTFDQQRRLYKKIVWPEEIRSGDE